MDSEWQRRIEDKIDELLPLAILVPELKHRIEEHIAKDDRLFFGDGNGAVGLIKAVDRLVQSERQRNKLIATLITSTIGLAVIQVWKWLFK